MPDAGLWTLLGLRLSIPVTRECSDRRTWTIALRLLKPQTRQLRMQVSTWIQRNSMSGGYCRMFEWPVLRHGHLYRHSHGIQFRLPTGHGRFSLRAGNRRMRQWSVPKWQHGTCVCRPCWTRKLCEQTVDRRPTGQIHAEEQTFGSRARASQLLFRIQTDRTVE